MARPTSISEIAERSYDRSGCFDAAVREFLDAWQRMKSDARKAAISAMPRTIGPVHDAYLAALAEHLALSCRLHVPEWTEEPGRFLSEPFFSGGLESLKATLLVESPLAFRRRLIFISADGLTRPQRAIA